MCEISCVGIGPLQRFMDVLLLPLVTGTQKKDLLTNRFFPLHAP